MRSSSTWPITCAKRADDGRPQHGAGAIDDAEAHRRHAGDAAGDGNGDAKAVDKSRDEGNPDAAAGQPRASLVEEAGRWRRDEALERRPIQ